MTPVLEKSDIEAAIGDVAPEYGIRKAYLFGSYARGEATPASDVDVAVECERPLGFARGALFNALEQRLGRDVDIVFNIDSLYPFVRDSFERERIVVYDCED